MLIHTCLRSKFQLLRRLTLAWRSSSHRFYSIHAARFIGHASGARSSFLVVSFHFFFLHLSFCSPLHPLHLESPEAFARHSIGCPELRYGFILRTSLKCTVTLKIGHEAHLAGRVRQSLLRVIDTASRLEPVVDTPTQLLRWPKNNSFHLFMSIRRVKIKKKI